MNLKNSYVQYGLASLAPSPPRSPRINEQEAARTWNNSKLSFKIAERSLSAKKTYGQNQSAMPDCWPKRTRIYDYPKRSCQRQGVIGGGGESVPRHSRKRA